MDRWGRSQKNKLVYSEYSATLQADVICRGYAGILLSARVIPWIQGGTADKHFYSPLTESVFLSRVFFMLVDFGRNDIASLRNCLEEKQQGVCEKPHNLYAQRKNNA